jgi:hypothetical protein
MRQATKDNRDAKACRPVQGPRAILATLLAALSFAAALALAPAAEAGTLTPNKGLTQPALNGDNGLWGSLLNGDLAILDNNLGGTAQITVSSPSTTVTAAQAQDLVLSLTGGLTANTTLVLPSSPALYIVWNQTTGPFTLTVATTNPSGSTVAVQQGTAQLVWSNGTNVTALYALPTPPTIASVPITPPSTTATAQQGQSFVQFLTGTLTGNASYLLPQQRAFYLIVNATSGNFTLTVGTTGGGSTIVVPQGTSELVFDDGTNISAPAQPAQPLPAQMSSPGYQRLPSGLLIEWLASNCTGGGGIAFSWPVAFPNAIFNVEVTADGIAPVTATVTNVTTSGGTVICSSTVGVFISAIGN